MNHSLVTLVGQTVPGLLMTPEALKPNRFPQLLKNIRHFAHPNNKVSSPDSQLFPELFKRLAHELEMTAVRIVSPPETWLKAVEANDPALVAGL